MAPVLHYVLVFGIGALAGLLGGIFGISGGSIAIPSMSFLGHTQQVAQGTSLVMQLPNLVLGAWHYTRRGQLDLRKTLVLPAFGMPLSYAGAFTATHIPSRELRLFFGCFFVFIATFSLWNGLRLQNRRTSRPLHWYHLAALGAIGGFASGLFGVGGPALLVPSLVLFFGVLQTVAQGMSLYLAAPSTIVGLITYARAGDVDWLAGIALALGGSVLVATGVAVAHRLPDRALRILFSFFMYALAGVLLAEASHA